MGVRFDRTVGLAGLSRRQPDPMPGRQIHGQRAPASPSSKAFKEANRKMMYVMVVPMTGDADGVSLLL
jgi:hypothetical protein